MREPGGAFLAVVMVYASLNCSETLDTDNLEVDTCSIFFNSSSRLAQSSAQA